MCGVIFLCFVSQRLWALVNPDVIFNMKNKDDALIFFPTCGNFYIDIFLVF